MPNNTINNYCLICGKGYHVCHSCREVRTFSPWRSITDTANCFKIYRVLSDYNGKYITKEQAREQLLNCDLTAKDTFKERPRNTINEILGETHKASRRKKTPVVETVSAVEGADPVEDVAPETETVAETVTESGVDICE